MAVTNSETNSGASSEPIPTAIIDAYTSLVPIYNEGDGVGEWMFGDLFLREVTPSMKQALDVGCGTGRLALLLSERIPLVMGIDVTPAMIEAAKQRVGTRPGVEFVVGDVQTYSFSHGFDLITAIYSLGYVDRAATIRKLYDLLLPSGKLLIVDEIVPEQQYAPPLIGLLKEFLYFCAFRVRQGVGINVGILARNLGRVGALYKNTAWKVCEKYHESHGISAQAYKTLVTQVIPTAQVYIPAPSAAFVIAEKKP